MKPQMTLLDVLYNLFGFMVFGFYALLVVGIVLRVIMKRRPIGVSLAWLALILAIPVVGVSAYLILGEVNWGVAELSWPEQCTAHILTGCSNSSPDSSRKQLKLLSKQLRWLR